MPKSLLLLALAIALAACDSSSVDTPVSSSAPQPNPVSITETSITDDQATVSWSASGPEPAEHWRLYQNNLLVCSEDLDIDLSSSDANGNYQQSSACTINLEEGDNSVYVQLCNFSTSGASNCSTSATTQISYEAADPIPGAISWQDLPSSTSNTTITVTWLKADGGNGDYWFVYHNDAQACAGDLSYTEDYVAQSADCEVSLTEGVNQLQAELCYDQPAGIQDLCTQSEVASVTLVLDPTKELATPVLDALDESEHYAGIDTNISWYKDTSVGSAGEDWALYRNDAIVCQDQLTNDFDSASCVIQLIKGENTLQVELCTDIATYSGASCAQSDTLTVSGLDPNPLEPGTMQITNAILGETFDNSLPLDWAMAAGNGVQHWNVYLNGVEYCATSSSNEYYEAGSCLLNLVVGINSISVSGCNYGYADTVACTNTDTISTERIALPGAAELTSSLPTTTYDAEHNLGWERNTGASAEYWFASVVSDIDANQCKTELIQQTPQSDSCIVELGSGHNEVYVQTCVYNHNRSSSYCVDSDRLYTELLAPIPATPEISTESQSIAGDSIEIRWSKSSGANGSYWAVINNDAEVAACADQPVITAGDGQSGSCDLPLGVGENIVSVRLCADNAAGTASCADSDTISITRLVASPEFTSATTVTTAENGVAVFYTATVDDNDSSAEQISFALSGGADVDFFQLDSTSGALAFQSPVDYETPQDSDADNVYQLNITATDELGNSAQLELVVSLSNINDNPPSLTAPPASLSVAENNSAAIYTFTASDLDGDTLSYSLDGADAQHFTLGTTSGALAFNQDPNYESPQDVNADNNYELSIIVTDSAYTASQDFSITVTDVNEAPTFTESSVALTTAENNLSFAYTIAAAIDPDQGQTLTYQLSGDDQSVFILDPATLALAFITTPNYETPKDQDSDNTYQIAIVATDDEYSASQSIVIAVSDYNDEAPQFTSSSSQTVDYTTVQVGDIVYTALATDADAGDQVAYALGGTDSGYFTFDSSSGALAFYQLPALADFPEDGRITYALSITATDLATNSSTLELSVHLLNDTGSPPEFAQASVSISVDENSADTVYTAAATDVDPEDILAYNISGADADNFTINPSSGALAFNSPPDFEAPQDSNEPTNTYELTITATDSTAKQAQQSLTISVNNLNDNQPAFNLSSSTFSVPENSTAVATFTATDLDTDTLTYTLDNTSDANIFTLDPSSGALAFQQAPNFESPQDANADNIYQLSIVASDGEYQASQSITITVADLNDESPLFTSAASLAIDYTSVVVGAIIYTAAATDADLGDSVAYALDGADGSHFAFDSSSGELAFTQAPSQDSPRDADGDNSYELTITASDQANNSTELDLSINVVNDTGSAPTFASASASISVDENVIGSIYTAQATDVDPGDSLTYSIAGADSSLFTINSSSGELAFNASPDFEAPTDSGADNSYDLAITATDSIGNQAQQSLTVAVNNLNDNSPQFNLESDALSVNENTTAITTITASDADGDDLSFALVTSTDSSLFDIDPDSGALAFLQAPDFEVPQDSDADNTYELTLSVVDGANTSTASITVSVANIDEAPSFATSSQDLSVSENSSDSVYQAQASDPEQASLTYSASGADASLFTLDSSSGALAFITPPNYEAPLDADADNTYELSIAAADSANQVSQTVTVTITNVNEPPAFASTSVALNTTENDSSFAHIVDAAIDPDQGETLAYQLGGDDAAAFDLDTATRALSFKQSPNYESPTDQDTDNVYQIAITATDADYSTSQAITIAVANLNDEAPQFTSANTQSVDYTTAQVGAVIYTTTATDADANDQLSYTLSGADASAFSFSTSSGELAFAQLPSLTEFQSAGGDIIYQLLITATDLAANSSDLALTISLLDDTGSAPTFASASASIAVDENIDTTIYTAQAADADGDSLSYSISATDANHFTIDPASGDLTFISAPDYESPSDSGADNIYELAIAASDSIGNQAQQSLAISVNNLNDNQPQFNLSSSAFTAPENSTAVATIAASDADGDDLSFALMTSTDSDHFTLDPASGALAFNQAANYEDPQDANTDNTYQLELSVADGSHTTSQAITVAVADLNDEAPQFTSATTEAIDYSDIVLGATVYTATSTDADANDQISYTLGGADQQHFALDSSSGALAFSELPSLVNPKDANTDNTYELTITATDLGANSTDLALSISVIDTSSAPTFASASASISVDENTISTIYTAQATDADGDIITYSLTGADAEHFTIDPSSGDLSFNQAPDHEQPTDSDSDNTYDLAIVATDSVGKQAQQDLTISVNNLNDNQPAFNLSSNSFDVPESSTAVATIAASDADGDELSFALITTSDDSSHFTLDPASGDLSFNQAPDFEKPQDANTDNTYELELSVSDGSHTTSQAIAIKVTDVDGEPYFHSTADYVDSIFEGTEAPFLVLHIQAADAEDDADKKILYFTISGGDDADKFILNAVDRNSANLSFNLSPDFENPQDFDLDNNYSVTLQVEDTDENTAQHDFIVAVQDVNDEAPRLTSASSAEVNENSTEVFYIATAEDGDGSGDSLTFSLDSTNYPHHSTLFSINSSSGELKAANGLDYEHLLSSTQSNYYTIGIKVTDQAGNSSTSPLTITVIDDPDDAHPAAESGPQIPWFYSDSSGREHIRIPWVIYVGDGAIEWEMSVNGEVKCSVYSGLSSPLSSGTCAVPTSEFTIGSIDNTAQVSVLYPDGSRGSSKTITFGYAVPEAEGYYPEQSMDTIHDTPRLGFPSDCADVKIGEPVNHDSHDDCYDYLLYDHSFGGRFDDVPAYLWSGKYGRGFDVIAYFIEWGVYARDFDAHDLRANWLSTALYSFIKFEGDNTTADDECENCTFSGAVAIADPWAAFDKPFYMPGEEEKYADEANNEEELAEILADKAEMTGKGIFQQFWLLKQKFPHLKTCLSVGGWSFSRPFPLVASDPDKRATFAQSIVDMAVEYHFDCIDIDWEFPGKAGGDRVATHNGVATYDLDGDGISPFVDPSEADADYYVDLVATLRGEIVSRPEAAHIEINSAVYTSSEGMALMDYGAFADDLDGIHMMTYDYYGAWDPHTGLQAALYANTNPVSDDVALAYGNPYNPEHNIASAMARGVNNAIYNGFGQEIAAVDPGSATSSDVSQATLANVGIRQKIVPGLAFYGRNYSGVNMDTPDRGKYMVRATGTTGESDGSAEQLGWEPGNLNYVQLKGFYFHGDTVEGNDYYYADGYSTAGREWTYYWDDESQTPFLYDADTGSFVSYTDPRAIFYQTCHAAWHNSKGVMFWEASGDSGGNDLLMFIHLALKEYLVESDGRTYAICEDLKGIYQRDDVVYSDGSDGGGNDSDDGELDLAGYGLDELVDLGHFSEDIFSNFMFPWRNGDPSVSDGSETYTWDGFAKAADHFADFGFLNEGSIEDRLRELAAFFANTSQETHNSHGVYALINKDGVIGQGRYNAGYYYQQEQACAVGGADYGQDICSYCDASDTAYGVACDLLYENGSAKADDFYYGRGPMQLRWNYHYGAFGEYYYQDSDLLLYNPNMLVQDSEAAFASAIWYWMTERDGKPSAHDVMTLGNYSYDPESESSERYPGFGMTINVTRGESECGTAYDHDANRNRIGFFITYLNTLEDYYDPGQGLSPWVGTNGSEPSKSHDFPTKVEDLISEHQDTETYLSCKNMQNYE